jgi:hypothetical protein
MKTSSFPPVRVDPRLREAAESVLTEGETLSGFVEAAIRHQVERRKADREFLARGLAARAEARRTGKYIAGSEVIVQLEKRLAKARKVAAAKSKARA